MNRSMIVMVSAAALLTGAALGGEPTVFVEADGVVCIEAESTASELGKWKKHTDASLKDWVGGFLGEGCLQFTGNKEASGPPTSELTYHVLISEEGEYKLAVRGLEAPMETGEGDKANDCYVRMQGQRGWEGKFTKCVLLGASYKWSWNVKSEYAHHKFTIAKYRLAKGVHTFQVAGRSRNFFLDRVVLYKDLSDRQARNDKLEPSRRVTGEKAAELLRNAAAKGPSFDAKKDLLSLHYDHAPDQDDGHSAAADRTLLLHLRDAEWVKKHVLAVSGAYGRNKKAFNAKSDAVMDATFSDLGGWLSADADRSEALAALVKRWSATLEDGGDVWVKEGGQSDITADAVRQIKKELPKVDTTQRIHVVQHSNWNEKQTTPAALKYVKANTDYIRIRDANAYLNRKGGDEAFVKAATAHAGAGKAWKAAFDYYDPRRRLDFSDTGELLHILGLGELDIDAFRKRFLEKRPDPS